MYTNLFVFIILAFKSTQSANQSTIYDDETEGHGQNSQGIVRMPYFHCSGDDKSLAPFDERSYVSTGFVSKAINDSCIVQPVFGLNISESTIATREELQTLFNRARYKRLDQVLYIF